MIETRKKSVVKCLLWFEQMNDCIHWVFNTFIIAIVRQLLHISVNKPNQVKLIMCDVYFEITISISIYLRAFSCTRLFLSTAYVLFSGDNFEPYKRATNYKWTSHIMLSAQIKQQLFRDELKNKCIESILSQSIRAVVVTNNRNSNNRFQMIFHSKSEQCAYQL